MWVSFAVGIVGGLDGLVMVRMRVSLSRIVILGLILFVCLNLIDLCNDLPFLFSFLTMPSSWSEWRPGIQLRNLSS